MLYKTQLCSFYAKGICARGNKCNWAHGQMDVRPMPKFYKTRMCYTFLSGSYCEASKCTFAHTEEELRGSGKALRLCTKFVLDGYCNKGDRCPMAHSINQLDPSVKFSAAELMNRVYNDENDGYRNKSGKHNMHNSSHTVYNNNMYHVNNYNNNNNMKNSLNHTLESKEERYSMNHHPENEKNLKTSKKNRLYYYTHNEKKTCPDFPVEHSQGSNDQYYNMKKKKENENVMGGHMHNQGHAHSQELPVNEYVKNRKGKMDQRKHHELFKNEYHKGMESGKNGETIKMNENIQKAEYTTYAAVTDDEMNINMMNIGENINCKMYNYKNGENCDVCKCDRKTTFCYHNKPHTLDEFYQRPVNISEQNIYGISGINLGNVSNISNVQNVSTVGDIRTICNIEDVGTIENISNVNYIESVNTLNNIGNMCNVVHSCSMNSLSVNTCVSNSVCMSDNITIQNNQNHLQYNNVMYNNGIVEKGKNIKKMEKNNMGNSGKVNSASYNYHNVKKLGKHVTNYHDMEKSYFFNSTKKENMESVPFDSNTTYAYSKTNSNFYAGTYNEDIHTNCNNDHNNTIADSNNNVTVDMTISNLIDDETHEMEDNECENSQLSINANKRGAARSISSTTKIVPVNNGFYTLNNMNQMNREVNKENKNNEVEVKYKHMKTEGKKNKMKNKMQQHADKKEAEHIKEQVTLQEEEQEEQEQEEVGERDEKVEEAREGGEDEEKEEEEKDGKKKKKENEIRIRNETINYKENVHMGYSESINYAMKNQYSAHSAKARSHNNNNIINNNDNNNNYHMGTNFCKMNEQMLIYNQHSESVVGTNDQSMNEYILDCGYMGSANQMPHFHFKNAFQKTINVYNEAQQITPMMDVEMGMAVGMNGMTGIKLAMNKPNGNQYNNEKTTNARLIQNRQYIRDVQTINNIQNMNSAEIHDGHLNNMNSGSFNDAEHFVAEMNAPIVQRVGNVKTTTREENREVKGKGSGRRARRRGRGGNEKERAEKEQVHAQEVEAQVEQDIKANSKMEKPKTQKLGQGQGRGKGRGRGKGKVEAESKKNMENKKQQEREGRGEEGDDREGEAEVEEECSGEDELVNREVQKENQENGSDRMQHKLGMSINKTAKLENGNITNEENQVKNHDHTCTEQNEVNQNMEHEKEKEEEEGEKEKEEENVRATNETLNKKNNGNVYHMNNNSMNKLNNPTHNNFINKNIGNKLSMHELNRGNRNFTNTMGVMNAGQKNQKMHLNNFDHTHAGMIHTPTEASINLLIDKFFNAQKRECLETILKASDDIINARSHINNNTNIDKENSYFFFNSDNDNNNNNNDNNSDYRNILYEKYEHGYSSSLLNESIIINENSVPNDMCEIMGDMNPMGNMFINNFREHINEGNCHIENNQVVANMRLRCNINNPDNVNKSEKVYKSSNRNNANCGNNALRIQAHAQLHGRINNYMYKEMITQLNEQRNATMEGVTEIDIGMKMGVGMNMGMGMKMGIDIGMKMGMEMESERERERGREREVIGIRDYEEEEEEHNASLCNNRMNYFFTDFEKIDITNFNKYNYPANYLDTNSIHFNDNNEEFYENISNYIFDKNDTGIIKNSEDDFFLGEESFMNIGLEENEKQKQNNDKETVNSFNPLTYNFSGLCECLNKSSEDDNDNNKTKSI